MATTHAIRYYGGGDLSGYGLAAVANVRMLVNAGLRVQWIPLRWTPRAMQPCAWHDEAGLPLQALQSSPNDPSLADLPALIEATSRAVGHDTVIVHAPPELWPDAFESGRRNIGCVAWECDRPPAHWMPLLQQADHLVVPCTQNRSDFLRAGISRPIDVIGHVRRHIRHESTPAERAEARTDIGVPVDHHIILTVTSWDPRKNVPGLIDAFSRAFAAGDPVTLLIKTQADGHDRGPLYRMRPTRELAQDAISMAMRGRSTQAPSIRLIDDLVDGATIDILQGLAATYASTSCGEGFALGAFDAATLGRPVVMTGWGGQTDFLGRGWPGAIDFRMAPVPLWPPRAPSYFPGMRWAEPDLDHAARLLRDAVEHPDPHREAAHAIRERIYRQFAEPVLARDWLRVIHG